jgi:hypothetical protein
MKTPTSYFIIIVLIIFLAYIIYKYKQSSVFASKVDRQGGRMRNSEMVTTHST